MKMRASTPAGVRVLACRVPVVRSLALANHRLIWSDLVKSRRRDAFDFAFSLD